MDERRDGGVFVAKSFGDWMSRPALWGHKTHALDDEPFDADDLIGRRSSATPFGFAFGRSAALQIDVRSSLKKDRLAKQKLENETKLD